MAEQVHQLVLRKTRHEELVKVMHDGLNGDGKSYKMNPMFEYIANLIEQAYIAGYHVVDISNNQVSGDINDIASKVLAEQFVKDKGLRI